MWRTKFFITACLILLNACGQSVDDGLGIGADVDTANQDFMQFAQTPFQGQVCANGQMACGGVVPDTGPAMVMHRGGAEF